MKYLKLGLLAVTLSLTALVIALDKKDNKKCSDDSCDEIENDISEASHTIIVEEE